MKEILLAACGGFVAVKMLEVHILLRVNRKPLNCVTCLSGWFCLLLSIQSYYWMDIPFMMAASMMTGAFLNYLMKKLL